MLNTILLDAIYHLNVKGHAAPIAEIALDEEVTLNARTLMLSSSPLAKETIEVIDHRMAFHARGEGLAILSLHGNPTSSYLWRNVLPPLDGLGRLIAPDLIGMGDSEKLARPDPDTYNYATHRRFIWAFIESALRPNELIIFVTHDWGSALAFDWAFHHQDRVAGIAYMEAIVRPFADWSEARRDSGRRGA